MSAMKYIAVTSAIALVGALICWSHSYLPERQDPLSDLTPAAGAEIAAIAFAEFVLTVGAVIGLVRRFRTSPARNAGVAGVLLMEGFLFPFLTVEWWSREAIRTAAAGVGPAAETQAAIAIILILAGGAAAVRSRSAVTSAQRRASRRDAS